LIINKGSSTGTKCSKTCLRSSAANVVIAMPITCRWMSSISFPSRGMGRIGCNLAIACHGCNQRKGNMTAAEFRFSEIQARARQTLRDAALVTATCWAVYNKLKETGLSIECGSSVRTKMNRIMCGLPKEYYYDARCVGKQRRCAYISRRRVSCGSQLKVAARTAGRILTNMVFR